MTKYFEFATASRIVFGAGTAATLPTLAQSLGTRPLLLTGNSGPPATASISNWQPQNWCVAQATVNGEPTITTITDLTNQARAAQCDVIVAIGGGSVIDSAKAVAALLTNGGDLLDYLEVVGHGKPLTVASAPVIAAPTTAGTGAEVTRNAVLAVPDQRVKVSLRSPTMLPPIALIDPELTYSMPPALTASTGLDALTQCIEPYVSNQANPLTDGIAEQGIIAAARSLARAYHAGSDHGARADMALASLCGGLALANAKLGAVHGFAGVIGGMFPVPHGVVCARLLPAVIAANVAALRERAPSSPYLDRFDRVAQLLTGKPEARASDGVRWIDELYASVQVAPLHTFGVTPGDFDEIIAKSKSASSMKGNPIPLTDAELHAILTVAH